MSEVAEQTQEQTGPVVARAGTYYRRMRYVMVAVVFGYGLWSIRDGFYRYPAENEAALQKMREEAVAKGLNPDKVVDPEKVPHPGWDVPFNKTFGIVLPPLAVFMLCFILYRSRGEYRLDGATLSVPGHPPVPFENITEIDRRLWDKKGIAYIDYDLGDGRQGRLKLDDFVYEREPTDQIFDRIEKYVNPSSDEQVPSAEKEEENTST